MPPRAQFLLKFTPKIDQAAIEYVISLLRSYKLTVNDSTLHQADNVTVDEENWFIIVSAPQHMLAEQAEAMKMIRKLKRSEEPIEKIVIMTITAKHLVLSFKKEYQPLFELDDEGYVFTSSEEIWLLYHIIQNISFDPGLLNIKKKGKGKRFLTCLMSSDPPIIEEAYPLHETCEKEKLSQELKRCLIPSRNLNITVIRNYFGEEVGFYFAWMNYYSMLVLLSGIIGGLMYLLRPSDNSVDTDPYLPFYSVIIAIWGILFLVFWQRKTSVLSFEWNTYKFSTADEERPEFHGVPSKDPVTYQSILYYPQWKRQLWYIFSALAMLPLLFAGVLTMTLSLNLNGYVKDPSNPIYVQFLAQYSKPGSIFAADSPYFGWLVPTIAHSIIISAINAFYSHVAVKCTDLENHRTIQDWNTSYVVKRVFFESFDCFMPLFYIAFYQLDVITLRAEISSLFMSDEIRRIILESVLPLVKEVFLATKMQRKGNKQKCLPPHDLTLTEYDLFDDYLEMVIQFGYITLFASAFTLGPLVTLLFLYCETRSDFFKILHAYKRPLPRRCKNIGVWFQVMTVMVFVSILTNCAILGFASEQLMQWLPSLFTRRLSDGDQAMALGSGRYVVGIVFFMEHFLILLALFIHWIIPTSPEWVTTAIARREFLAQQRMLQESGNQKTKIQ